MPNRPKSDNSIRSYIGVDPGKQGGMVLISGSTITWYVMPTSPLDVWRLIQNLYLPETIAFVEHVFSMPRDGHKGAFTFGRGVGQLEMAFMAAGIPLEVVTPKKWQSAFSIPGRKKGEPQPLLKERCRAKAQAMYPKLEIWNQGLGKQRAVCDALLIATYGMRLNERK